MEVTEDDIFDASIIVAVNFPGAYPDGAVIAAAVRKANQLGCNPGGEMASVEIQRENPMLVYFTRGVLMSRAEIERIDNVAMPLQ